MKKMILMAVAVIVGTASAETLTGKIANYQSGANASVCMNGKCATVQSDGSYSLLDVPTAGIAARHSNVTEASDLYRLGQRVVSASGKQVELINMKGQRVASDKGSLDISKVPNGVYMATDGRHVLRFNTIAKGGYATAGTGTMANGVSARAADTTKLLGTAYVVVNGDTLKEIPVTSWNLPTGWMVGRSHAAHIPSKLISDTAQVVYWTNDSVAYVVNLRENSTKKVTTYRSAFIYSMYDSAAYATGDSAYSYFYRVRNNTVLAYTDIGAAESGSGDAETADSSDFHLTTYNRTGYSYVPALDTIKKWVDSTSLNYNGQWIGIPTGFVPDTAGYDRGGFVYYGSTSQPSCIMISSATLDSAGAAAAMAGIDSVRISYNIASTGPDTTRLNVLVPYYNPDNNSYIDAIYLANGHTSVRAIGKATVTDTSVAYALPVSRKIPNYIEYGRIFWVVASIDYNPQAMANVRIRFHVRN